MVYANTVEYQEHLALIKGDVSGCEPVLVRMHAVDLLDDMTGSPHWIAVAQRHAHDRQGRPRRRGVHPRAPPDRAGRTGAAAGGGHHRGRRGSCAITASVRRSCSTWACSNMVLLTNHHRTVIGLEGYGLNIVEQRPIPNVIGVDYEG